jgi:putative ABC transport system ATP-binding protein
MTAIVSLQGVCRTVLQDLDLTIEAGEFVALLGPSGSGKTTLLSLIGGLDHPDTGTVTVAGLRLDRLSTRALRRWRAQHVGFVFQLCHLLPILSAERNVEVPLLATSLSRYERRRNARAALDFVGLVRNAEHKPSQLSGSQQQRVAIARALVADPAILVCDEPTGELDRQTAKEVLDLLQNVNEHLGTSIVMATHDPRTAARASRIVQIQWGRVVPPERHVPRIPVASALRAV